MPRNSMIPENAEVHRLDHVKLDLAIDLVLFVVSGTENPPDLLMRAVRESTEQRNITGKFTFLPS